MAGLDHSTEVVRRLVVGIVPVVVVVVGIVELARIVVGILCLVHSREREVVEERNSHQVERTFPVEA